MLTDFILCHSKAYPIKEFNTLSCSMWNNIKASRKTISSSDYFIFFTTVLIDNATKYPEQGVVESDKRAGGDLIGLSC